MNEGISWKPEVIVIEAPPVSKELRNFLSFRNSKLRSFWPEKF